MGQFYVQLSVGAAAFSSKGAFSLTVLKTTARKKERDFSEKQQLVHYHSVCRTQTSLNKDPRKAWNSSINNDLAFLASHFYS